MLIKLFSFFNFYFSSCNNGLTLWDFFYSLCVLLGAEVLQWERVQVQQNRPYSKASTLWWECSRREGVEKVIIIIISSWCCKCGPVGSISWQILLTANREAEEEGGCTFTSSACLGGCFFCRQCQQHTIFTSQTEGTPKFFSGFRPWCVFLCLV